MVMIEPHFGSHDARPPDADDERGPGLANLAVRDVEPYASDGETKVKAFDGGVGAIFEGEQKLFGR